VRAIFNTPVALASGRVVFSYCGADPLGRLGARPGTVVDGCWHPAGGGAGGAGPGGGARGGVLLVNILFAMCHLPFLPFAITIA
jgi:hypothetical protein